MYLLDTDSWQAAEPRRSLNLDLPSRRSVTRRLTNMMLPRPISYLSIAIVLVRALEWLSVSFSKSETQVYHEAAAMPVLGGCDLHFLNIVAT